MVSKKKSQQNRKTSLVEYLRTHPDKHKDPIIYFRLVLAEYLSGKKGEALTNQEKKKRKSILIKVLGRSEQTLKAMSRSGQGSLKNWLLVIAKTTDIDSKTLVSIIRMFPYLQENLSSLSPAKRKIFEKLEQTNNTEDELINVLLEAGLEQNRLSKAGKKAIKINKS